MRIVALSDTHLFHDELEVPDGDILVHAGDLCRGGTLDELEVAAAFLRSLPHRHKVVVAGNHDRAFVNEPAQARALLGPEVTYLEDAEAVVGGLRFWGSPWQPEFRDWAFNLPRGAALAEKWALIPAGLDVLVTHGPPLGIGDGRGAGYGGADRLGCADLLAAVRRARPVLHLFGHLHDSGGAWVRGPTTFANVTTWECERECTVLDLEPETKVVTLVRVPPAETEP
jgi:Icc-related predicted phosphoesterase